MDPSTRSDAQRLRYLHNQSKHHFPFFGLGTACLQPILQLLGVTEVDKPKGNEIVREAIKRLKV